MANWRVDFHRAFAFVWYALFRCSLSTRRSTSIEDVSAFLIIVFSTKRRGRTLVASGPGLLDKILQDATAYFLVLFTGHLVFVFFELFASVSGRPPDL